MENSPPGIHTIPRGARPGADVRFGTVSVNEEDDDVDDVEDGDVDEDVDGEEAGNDNDDCNDDKGCDADSAATAFDTIKKIIITIGATPCSALMRRTGQRLSLLQFCITYSTTLTSSLMPLILPEQISIIFVV